MGSAVSFIVFGLQVSVSQAVDCPAPFNDTLGVCVHFPDFTKKWCEAQEYCSSIGGELVRGSSFLPLNGQTFSGRPDQYWVGLTDFLHERGTNKGGWRWTDGALHPPSSGLTWWSGEPGPRDCAREKQGKLAEAGCGASFVPMCQPRPLPGSADRYRHFEAVPIPVGLPAEALADKGGCSKLLTKAKSELHCARLCAIEPQDWCVSFYFNEARQECRLVLYTDATINMGDAERWKKFATKK